MRCRLPARPLALLAVLALAACAGPGVDLGPAPQAVLSGSHEEIATGVATFRVTGIAGHPVGRADEPSRTLGVDARYPVDAGHRLHVEFEGLLRYANPLSSLMRDAHRVEGSADFEPAAGAHYVVRGRIDADGSAVWLEDEATHAHIGEEFKATPKPTELRENGL